MKRNRIHLISIDPGFNGTGFVYWWGKDAPFMGHVATPPRNPDKFVTSDLDIGRAHWIAETCFDYIGMLRVEHVIIELPEFQAGAGRQMGWKTGDLQKLTMLVGVLAEHAVSQLDAHVMLATPSEWKGQLPKDVVQRRLTSHFGLALMRDLEIQTHAWDALGIGAWAYNARGELR